MSNELKTVKKDNTNEPLTPEERREFIKGMWEMISPYIYGCAIFFVVLYFGSMILDVII